MEGDGGMGGTWCKPTIWNNWVGERSVRFVHIHNDVTIVFVRFCKLHVIYRVSGNLSQHFSVPVLSEGKEPGEFHARFLTPCRNSRAVRRNKRAREEFVTTGRHAKKGKRQDVLKHERGRERY